MYLYYILSTHTHIYIYITYVIYCESLMISHWQLSSTSSSQKAAWSPFSPQRQQVHVSTAGAKASRTQKGGLATCKWDWMHPANECGPGPAGIKWASALRSMAQMHEIKPSHRQSQMALLSLRVSPQVPQGSDALVSLSWFSGFSHQVDG